MSAAREAAPPNFPAHLSAALKLLDEEAQALRTTLRRCQQDADQRGYLRGRRKGLEMGLFLGVLLGGVAGFALAMTGPWL